MHSARQGPVDGQADARIAGIVPIAVPALVGLHEERERDLAARRGAHGLGDQAGADMRPGPPPNCACAALARQCGERIMIVTKMALRARMR